MNLKNLDYASIVAMYENAGKKGIADIFIYKALDNYSDDKNPDDYDFLKNRTLTYAVINHYKDNEKVLCLLARKKVEPKEYIWDLIGVTCSYNTIKRLVKEGIMPKMYLEESVIKGEQYSCYEDIFSDEELKDIDYNLLLFNFMKLEQNIADISFLNCIEIILKEMPYDEEYHLPLAKVLCRNEYANLAKIQDIIKYFLNKNSNDFETILQNRPDILYLFRYLRSGKINTRYIDSFLEIYKRRSIRITEEIMSLGEISIAWCVELYEIGENERINILNYWARNNQVTAFDTYYKYFTSDNLDYENVGKILDEEFKNKMAEEPYTPLVRERVNDGKIVFRGLASDAE